MMRAFEELLTVALLAPVAAQAQVSNVRPGQYEITVDMRLGQSTTPAQPTKHLECVTAADLKDAAKLLAGGEMENCKVSDVKTSGNKTRFAIACEEDGSRMTGTAEMTFGTDTITQLATMKDGESRSVTMRVFARRLGECK
jgi:hypothetical protein